MAYVSCDLMMCGGVELGLTAAGASQATALLIPGGVTQFATVGTGTGGILPAPGGVGQLLVVTNNGANALLVYPPVGGKINNGTVNVGLSVAAGKSAIFFSQSTLDYAAVVSA